MGKRYTTEDFIRQSRAVHGDTYDYSKAVYTTRDEYITIICRVHGEFKQYYSNHRKGVGCKKCGEQRCVESKQLNMLEDKKKRLSEAKLDLPDSVKAIPLTQGKFALVDEEDFEKVFAINWNVSEYGYAVCKGNIRMHRFIMGVIDSEQVIDHRDGNPLNNCKSNLRVCTQQKNVFNQKKRNINTSTSQYKGVSYDRFRDKWRVALKYNGVSVLSKRVDSELEGAKLYDIYAKQYFGEFAYLNFPNN